VEHPVLDDALRRVEAARKKLRKPDRFCLERFEDINRQIWDLRVATLGEERAKVLSVEDGKRSPVELY
jgi:beta-N-acetylhexosaminidase